MSTIGRAIRRVIWSRTLFEFWQKLGFHVTRNHFYSPIPDTRELAHRGEFWSRPSELPGVDMNVATQLRFLEEVFPDYKAELDFPVDRTEVPHEFFLNNPAYGIIDASVLHLMIRHFKPTRLIEVGSGYSTFVAARASLMNRDDGHPCTLTSIEPYPREVLRKGFPGLDGQIPSKVEDVAWSFFAQLGENDILFIDSTHVVRTGNDVLYLYLEVLPRLSKGVVVHIHDIFFPFQYPRQWVIENRVFWTEQYLLQAFLCGNTSFEVQFGNHFMKTRYPEKMEAFFAAPEGYRPRHRNSSFWIRKIA